MQILINQADPLPIYIQIMDEVRRAISIGTIHPNEALPSIRQVATKIRVNPHTVLQAYRELEREGVVHFKRGKGTFISDSARGENEREVLTRRVAERVLREVHLNGISVEDLITALRNAAAHQLVEESTEVRVDS